jgi:hypothetical protein
MVEKLWLRNYVGGLMVENFLVGDVIREYLDLYYT